MTESEFISTAKSEIITISDSILALHPMWTMDSSPGNSIRIKHADDFENEFHPRCQVLLFNLLREFESRNHTTILFSTGKKIEQIYDMILKNYGNHIAWARPLDLDIPPYSN